MGRMTKSVWADMRREYEHGASDLGELASVHGLKLETVKKRANDEKWKRDETDKTIQRLKNHRMTLLEAICNSTMEGLKKADVLLVECDSLRDVELHSKTVKNYKDICIGKSPDEFLKEERGVESGLAELEEQLCYLTDEDAQAVCDVSE